MPLENVPTPDDVTTCLDPKHGELPRRLTRKAVQAPERSDTNDPAETGVAARDPGKFAKMFPDLPPLVVDDDRLLVLARAMEDKNEAEGENHDIPAGFTYLGQFVDHDVTLDLTPINAKKIDPDALQNFRTPALDLDALYGLGPEQQPYMYERLPTGKLTARMLLGRTDGEVQQPGGPFDNFPNDLPRNSVGRALIGDERNDENLVVAQTHLAFLKFHNAVVRHLEATTSLEGGALFDEARRLVTWHYQWIVLFDFVEKLTEPGLIRRIKHEGRKFYRFVQRDKRNLTYIPIEFSAAAYRLGHSMVRERYDYNRVFSDGAASLELLFHFTGKSGAIVGDLLPDVPDGTFNPPGAFRALPSNWIIDWNRFYDLGNGTAVNPTRSLNPFIAKKLHTLPGEPADDEKRRNLAFRNLRRGVMLELPSGQAIAEEMGVAALTPDEIARGTDGAAAKEAGLLEQTPLWYYILKEAEVRSEGKRLGPVGATIVAETFLGLVHGDQKSFMWLRSDWKPELPSAQPGHFTMADMLNFVGELNPIG